jgi:hypothetical protein
VGKSSPENKSFQIPKRLVWEAYQRVKANKGAAGVDGQSVEEFEADLKNTSTRSGIGCPRGRIFRLRCGQLRYRSRMAGGRECWAFPPSPTGSLKQWWRYSWNLAWSQSFMTTRTGTGRGALR